MLALAMAIEERLATLSSIFAHVTMFLSVMTGEKMCCLQPHGWSLLAFSGQLPQRLISLVNGKYFYAEHCCYRASRNQHCESYTNRIVLKKSPSGKSNAAVKMTTKERLKPDQRSPVAQKYLNPNGKEKWTGRGLAPGWVMNLYEQENIDIENFKLDPSFEI